MSTFEGRMKEYRLVSIDRFDGENLSSTVFFLSHIHTDHTVGLDQGAFFEKLKQRGNSYLYCSEITRILLLGNKERYGHLAPYVKPLETLCPTTIDIPAACHQDQNSTILVTLLPAAHCLGSVIQDSVWVNWPFSEKKKGILFLFEGDEGNVLYTGDFRWGMSEATKMPYLDPSSKPLRSIYVDTTFCIPKAFYIPSRKQCEDGVISLVNSHFQEYGPNGHVWIESRTKYGHETLLKELSIHMKMKIHVDQWKKVLYDQIPSLKDIFTEDAEETRIHAHPKNTWKQFSKNALPCGYLPLNNEINLIQIRPSTMWFTTLPEITNIVQQAGIGRYRACYSFHSSYSEIRDLVQYLKPTRVFPSVIPVSKTFDEVQNTLNSFLSTPHYKHFSSVESEEQPLGIMKIPKELSKDSFSLEDCAFDDTPNLSGNSQEKKSVQNSQSKNGQEETSVQNSQSSYDGSRRSDSELDLYSSEESQTKDQLTENSLPLSASIQSSCSLPTYIEDNSDDSEYEEEVSQNEHLKLPTGVNSSNFGGENKKSAETSLKVPESIFSAKKDEEQKIKDLSDPAHIFMSDIGNKKQEHKKEWDSLEAAHISNVSDSSNEQEDKKEEKCIKKSKNRINLEEIFGSQKNFFVQLNNSEPSYQIHRDENSSVFISSKNLRDKGSVPEPDRQNETDTDGYKESPSVSSHESLNGNSVDSIEDKAVDINQLNKEMDMGGDNLVTIRKENSCNYNLKPSVFKRKFFSSSSSEKHGRNNKTEECSQEKFSKMDLSLKSVNLHLNEFPLEEFDPVETAADKKEVLECETENICQEVNHNKKNPITSPKRFAISATKEIQENNQLMKCDDTLSSFNTKTETNQHQNLNSKDIFLTENIDNKILPIDLTDTNIRSKKCNDEKEIKSSQESTKTDASIEILKIVHKDLTVIELDDSDDCIAIDSDSDETLPPSPSALESSQERFSSNDAINVNDSCDDVVIIETSDPIQNGSKKG